MSLEMSPDPDQFYRRLIREECLLSFAVSSRSICFSCLWDYDRCLMIYDRGWESKRLHPDWIFLIHLSHSQFPFHHPSVGHGHMLLKASSARIKSLIQINKKNKYNWAMVLQAKLSRFSKASQLYYLTSYDVQLPSETHELFHVRHVTQCSDHGCHGNLDVPLGRWS